MYINTRFKFQVELILIIIENMQTFKYYHIFELQNL